MRYLLVHRAWKNEVGEDGAEVELMHRGLFYSSPVSRRVTVWVESPQVRLLAGERLIQLTRMVYVEKKSFVIFQHETSSRIFSLTSRIHEDSIDDGLMDISCCE